MQSTLNNSVSKIQYFLQIIHGNFDGPFVEAARATCKLIHSLNHTYRVVTVFIYEDYDYKIAEIVGSDEIIFLNAERKDLKGAKRKLIRRFKDKISHHNYDFCIAHRSKSTRIALEVLNCPVISVHHAYGDYQNFFKRFFLNKYKKRVTLVGVSESVTQELRKKFRKWPEYKFQTLYNRIDIDSTKLNLMTRESARNELLVPSDSWVIGHVARLHPIKDQQTLLRAFAKAKDHLPSNARLVIIGNGREAGNLKALAKNINIQNQIHFAGYHKMAKTLFRAFDCFVLTSIEETFGMVLLEAMAANIPIIVSDCGGAVEVVGECARIFPVGDVNSLAEKIIEQYQVGAIASPEQIENRLKEKFSDEAAIENFQNILYLAES